MGRTEFVFALAGIAIGLLVAPAGLPVFFEKMFFAGVLVLMVLGFVSIHGALHRLRTAHPKIYSEIGAISEDLSWGIGDAFHRFMKFIRSSHHWELDDNLLSTAVVVGWAIWRLSFALAGFILVFAVRSLTG
ncbi:hypothetical protein ACEN8I_20040 [Polaromonas sp. CT11-55]|uniref:hypothetical protein n=1 Tax=Polaromonas sp. CT11-55 TaxID=3243045 RepID=UPI0039A64D0B